MSTFNVGKVGLGAAGATAVVALVAACGSSSSSGTPAGGGGASSTAQHTPGGSGSASGLKTSSTSIGTVLVDRSGRTVYELVGDSTAKQTCTGPCLAIWPAVKANGSQVIVHGHPAFTYAGDKSAGQTNGQNLTDRWGRWLALDAGGNPIGASAAASSKAPASQSSASKSTAPGGGGPAF
jgi:predicted lipoprotein with Yx(FWY)xxD motif